MGTNTEKRKASELESILFVHGDPLERKRVKALLDIDEEELTRVIEVLKTSYESEERGLSLVVKDDILTIVTRLENASVVQKMVHRDLFAPLSRSILEVLSIVAYRAPITRQEIEQIRGVNSSFALRNLCVRGLIERAEHEEDSRLYIYRPASLMMESLGITSLSQLPDYEQLSQDSRLVSASEEKKD